MRAWPFALRPLFVLWGVMEVPPAVDDTVIFGDSASSWRDGYVGGSASGAGGMVGVRRPRMMIIGGGGWDIQIGE